MEGRQTGGKNSKGYQALSLRPKVELGKKRKEARKLGGKLGVSSTSLYQLGRIFQVYNKMKSCFDEGPGCFFELNEYSKPASCFIFNIGYFHVPSTYIVTRRGQKHVVKADLCRTLETAASFEKRANKLEKPIRSRTWQKSQASSLVPIVKLMRLPPCQ